MYEYEVVVGNIGTVYFGECKREAFRKYREYVENSLAGYGRGGNEIVTLFQDREIIKEHFPLSFEEEHDE